MVYRSRGTNTTIQYDSSWFTKQDGIDRTINLRTQPFESAPLIAQLNAGQEVKYEAYGYEKTVAFGYVKNARMVMVILQVVRLVTENVLVVGVHLNKRIVCKIK